MLVFRHLNLEASETEYKGKKIEVRQNINRTWDMWVNGNKVEHEPFSTRKEAINHVINVIKQLNPSLVPETLIKEKDKTRPKHNGRPKACKVCGSTSYPHRCMKMASKELKPRRVR